MSAAKRAVSLRRIVKLYEAIERRDAAALHRSSAAVQEAEAAIVAERRAAASASIAGRAALGVGDREGWMFSESQVELAAMRRIRFERLRNERGAALDAARTEFLESRMRTEQVSHVLADGAKRVEMEERRRTQAVSDDRFLMQLYWLHGRD